MPAIHTRIAPTPSGYLHKGNAFNFLLGKQTVQISRSLSLKWMRENGIRAKDIFA
ncbi:MAG: hypothetical protein KBG24_01345 [Bacteroidia bacterium]|nr:hypothetical protein [Bacteroidia bacterium]MBP9724697.1 hypothetical protein [Bacteroidia bacterium]